jgi:hypothetical protein
MLNRGESATVLAGRRLLGGDGVRIPNYPRVLVAGLSDEVDAEYELRFDGDEEYVRELIDRIDEMSLRGVKLCNRCTEKHPAKWQGKPGKVHCAGCDWSVERHFVLQKAAAVARRTSRGVDQYGGYKGDSAQGSVEDG